MGLGHIKVIKGLTFLLKKNKSLIDLQLQLLEVTEPFNTKHGFVARLCHIHNFFNSELDAFTFLNLLYRAVYDSYLFNSLDELNRYMNTYPEDMDADYYKIVNDEIINLITIYNL